MGQKCSIYNCQNGRDKNMFEEKSQYCALHTCWGTERRFPHYKNAEERYCLEHTCMETNCRRCVGTAKLRCYYHDEKKKFCEK